MELRGAQRQLIVRIHVKDAHGRSTNRGLTAQINPKPLEVVFPAIPPWMKQLGNHTGLWIYSA
ncbi:MAG TPA: hypothetical protein VGN90_04375 [Pyrinomonadaceae bacterium]|nr:hypothetical protein [Pyrinomonadaceae bacterium]